VLALLSSASLGWIFRWDARRQWAGSAPSGLRYISIGKITGRYLVMAVHPRCAAPPPRSPKLARDVARSPRPCVCTCWPLTPAPHPPLIGRHTHALTRAARIPGCMVNDPWYRGKAGRRPGPVGCASLYASDARLLFSGESLLRADPRRQRPVKGTPLSRQSAAASPRWANFPVFGCALCADAAPIQVAKQFPQAQSRECPLNDEQPLFRFPFPCGARCCSNPIKIATRRDRDRCRCSSAWAMGRCIIYRPGDPPKALGAAIIIPAHIYAASISAPLIISLPVAMAVGAGQNRDSLCDRDRTDPLLRLF